MVGLMSWTPLLRGVDEGAPDATIEQRLPREVVGEKHPLALPRVKQRERRAAQLLGRRRGSPVADATVTPTSVDFDDAKKLDSAEKRSDDPFSILSPQPSNSGTPAKGRAGVKEERTRMVAMAGLSDDPLSMIMEQRAVARNISRHGGDVLEDEELDSLVPLSRSSPAQDSAKKPAGGSDSVGGSGKTTDNISPSNSNGKVDGGHEQRLESGTIQKSPGPAGGKSKGHEEGKEGWRGWSKRWDVHRMGMLREYSDGGALSSGADQAAGPSTPAPKSRYENRLAELDGAASGGASSGGSGGRSNGRKSDPPGSGELLGTGMVGGMLLTPAEYTSHVNSLRDELESAWANEEKVTALKVTVKAAKLLGDTSVPTFYPSLFAMIAALLETFGVMVFDRIRTRAEDMEDPIIRTPSSSSLTAGDKGASGGEAQAAPATQKPAPVKHTLRKGWTCNDISAGARETCRNWFYKTACIRELLPRILVEAALLPCYRFLATEDEFGQILGRLSTLVRGIGDPMVAVYCRCFISVAGHQIAPLETAHAAGSLQDYLFSLQEVKLGKMAGYLRVSGLGVSSYVNLHTPAVDWLMSIVASGAPRGVFTKILTHYRNHSGSLEILRLILKHFSSEHYAPFALEMAVLIKQGSGVSPRGTTAEVMALLGRRLTVMPPTGPDAVPLLNEAWQEISAAPLEIYAEGAAAWLGVLLLSPAYGPDEVAILVEDVACRVEGASPVELSKIQTDLAEGIIGSLSTSGDPAVLEAAGSHVVKILSVLDRGRAVQACLDLLMGFLRALTPLKKGIESDTLGASLSSHRSADEDAQNIFIGKGESKRPKKKGGGGGLVTARTLIGVAKLLHDGLDLLSSGEQERQSSVSLTCELVDRIGKGGWEMEGSDGDEGKDDKTCLGLLVECRRAFWAMDEVTERLVMAASGLAVRASRRTRVGGSIGVSADATARAALCFCATTVLSVPSVLRRLALLQLSAHAALQGGKLALADSLFRSAICVVPECSTLVVSGADPGAAATSFGRTSSTDSISFGLGAAAVAGGNEDSLWGFPGVEGGMGGIGGGSGVGGRKEHAGAWRLADAVRSLLGALVAAPGHPELGPFYLLRGLLKAIRRLPWPAGSGLLASLHISAVNVLCILWQKHLPYSIGSRGVPLIASHDEVEDKDESESNVHYGADMSAGPPDMRRTQVARVSLNVGDVAADANASASLVLVDVVNGTDGVVALTAGAEDQNIAKQNSGGDEHDESAQGGGGQDTGGDGAADDSPADAKDIGTSNASGDSARAEVVSISLEQADVGGVPAGKSSEARGEGAAAPKEEKYSWINVGGLLGTDQLYLRNSTYLKEIQALLSDVMRVALRELEELREQGEAEVFSSAMGGGQARAARVRYARLTLDLANQLVSGFRMEGGTANVVVFLIEASARAGAREGGIDMTAAGGGGIDDRRRRRKNAGYFDETVEFVAEVAKIGLERAREAKGHMSGNSEAEEAEEAALTLLQGLSGFSR